MNDLAAFKATFSDFRLVKGRKCAQLVFEVPLEAADAALAAMGGVPTPATERWVGIARLTEEAARRSPEARQEPKSTKPFHTLPMAQQAALRCGDSLFRQFLGVANEDEAAIRIRQECGVRSRADIEHDEPAKKRWHAILTDFDQYQRGFR